MASPVLSGLKLVGIIAAAMALVFVGFGGLLHGFSLRNIALLAVAGALLGAIGAPHIEPKGFRYPSLWQILFSILACVLLAAYLDARAEGFGLAMLVGLLLGYLAPYWIKHIQGP